VPVYTDLKNPDFGAVARAMGLWGRHVARAGELEESVKAWLAERGPALLHVKVKPMQLVTPPSPFLAPVDRETSVRWRRGPFISMT
jgi:pyruvate dehydrogenase (quinone)